MILSSRPLALVALVVLAGCSRSSPEQMARQRGLLPPAASAPAEDPLSAASTEEGAPEDSPLAQELRLLAEYPKAELPPLPPMPTLDLTDSAGSTYDGWTTDVIDASSFDALTNSLNSIMSRMPEDLAVHFDKLVKYVLMQVTKDPMVARKAAVGQPVSDAELLRLTQNYVDGRTPADILQMAQDIEAKQSRAAAPPPVMPMPSPGL